MKLFKSTILAMLGMAVALTSCSDDEDYIPATPKAGVYFPNTVSTEIQILPTESSIDIPVGRVKDGPSKATVTATAPAGFTVPSTVTFDGQATTANLTITYDPSKLTIGETYKVSLSLAEAATVGVSSADFLLTFAPELVTQKFEKGTGAYYYDLLGQTIQYDNVTYTYDPTSPGRTISIADWGASEVPFVITCDDFTPNADGVILVGTEEIDSGILDGDITLNCMDIQSYGKKFGFNISPQKYPHSYYDTTTGTFYMNVIYYDSTVEPNGSGYIVQDIFQMDGYPDYSIRVAYNGMITDRDGNATASCTITPGADVASVKAVLVPGEDPNVGLAQILQGGEGVLEFPYAEEIPVSIPVAEGGYYSFVAASFDNAGEAQAADADVFRLYIGANPDADWADVGNVDYADGWIIPSFNSNGVQLDPLEWAYTVPLQQHKEQAGVYRLIQPYGPEFPLVDYNAFPAKRNIVFSIPEPDMILFEPQPCGFGSARFGSEMIIGNAEGYYVSEGITFAQIRDAMKAEDRTTYEEGLITIPVPMFKGEEGFGYTWETVKPGYIFMPATSDEVRAKVKAASVAKPAIKGLRSNVNNATRKALMLKRSIYDSKITLLSGVK